MYAVYLHINAFDSFSSVLSFLFYGLLFDSIQTRQMYDSNNSEKNAQRKPYHTATIDVYHKRIDIEYLYRYKDECIARADILKSHKEH